MWTCRHARTFSLVRGILARISRDRAYMLLENVLYLIETASVERFLAKTEGHPPRNLLERVESSSQSWIPDPTGFLLLPVTQDSRADCCLVSRMLLIIGTLVGSL